jgi:predicted nucleotide-binding protein
MTAYFLYYLARYTLSFIVPAHKNHDDTRECVYDRKVNKLDLLKSMRARSLCDDCRKALLNGDSPLSPRQLTAVDKIFDLSGKFLSQNERDAKEPRLPRTFIGSSTEGLPVANKLQSLLEHDVDAEIWNQGTVFGLGDSTLEALEAGVQVYEFGVFVFTPDDQLQTRGITKSVARDNVIFELGLFVGKLSRRHAFVINPAKNAISLPSDLAGIATATYDPDKPNLAAALGPACQRIREAVARARMNLA